VLLQVLFASIDLGSFSLVFCSRITMTDRYKTLSIEGGLKYYSTKFTEPPVCCEFSKTHCELLEERNIIIKMLSCLLFPLALNPNSNGFLVYESVRVLLILMTAAIIPLQV